MENGELSLQNNEFWRKLICIVVQIVNKPVNINLFKTIVQHNLLKITLWQNGSRSAGPSGIT